MDKSNNKISTIINSQLPFFIREDHPNFALFIQKYYEFLEQYESVLSEGQVIERINNLLNNIDIDNTTHDEIDEELYKKFIADLPKDIDTDKAIILKYIKQFYRGKGSEKSLAFLIKIFTGDDDIEFYYPKKDILKTSDGKWFVQKSLRINDVRLDGDLDGTLETLEKFRSLEIQGTNSNGVASVETVNRFYDRGQLVSELYIADISGEFTSNDTVQAAYTDSNGASRVLTANVFGDSILSVIIDNGGSGYQVGQYIPFSSNTGTGANAIISEVSTGDIETISVVYGGAGFEVNNSILVTGGSGSGLNAVVGLVDVSETYHPNTYNLYANTIALESNTALNNTVYSNLNSSNANTIIQNALDSYQITNLGPIISVSVITPGMGYVSIPSISAVGNTTIRELGILGRMEIIDGGIDYQANDELVFVGGGSGYGASGRVTTVDGSGTISGVEFVQLGDFYIGGEGYSQTDLPTVTVTSANGTGANIAVTAILGYGETLTPSNTSIGTILNVDLLDAGSGYTTEPTIDMSGLGDGNANLSALIVSGYTSLPGIFLNDDGFLSSHNYLRGYHYYQNHSYVVRTRKSLKPYYNVITRLVHPAGTKIFSDLILDIDTTNTEQSIDISNYRVSWRLGSFDYSNANSVVYVTLENHGLTNGNTVYMEYESNTITNSIYTITSIDTNTFTHSFTSNNNYSGTVLIGENSYQTID